MNNPGKTASLSVTNSKCKPADFPLGSVESRAAARAEAERKEGKEVENAFVFFTNVLWTVGDYPVVSPPDSVSYHQAKNGSIVEVFRRHWKDGSKSGWTIFVSQGFPDGTYLAGKDTVKSLAEALQLPLADEVTIERLNRYRAGV